LKNSKYKTPKRDADTAENHREGGKKFLNERRGGGREDTTKKKQTGR